MEQETYRPASPGQGRFPPLFGREGEKDRELGFSEDLWYKMDFLKKKQRNREKDHAEIMRDLWKRPDFRTQRQPFT